MTSNETGTSMKRKLLAALVLAAATTTTLAQEWPIKPVKIIAPFAPASTPDTLARVLAQRLQAHLKQPFTVENKQCAGGMMGTDAVAKAAPDGYTLAGDVQMACLPALAVLPQVKTGKLRILGASTAKRSTLLPDVPTLKEQGLVDVDAGAWIGVVAPAATPKAVLQRVQTEIAAVLKDPEVVRVLSAQMMEVVAGTAESFSAFMREEHDRWTPVIAKNKIALD
jgi:tripartite-type tricarboxylate transporter receptor subunit TctC